MNKDETEFLKESNAIEREYSDEALEDAKESWEYAKEQEGNMSTKFILGIHKRLLKRLNPKIAGKIRDVGVWVGRRKCLDSDEIRKGLRLLCNPGIYPISSENLIKRWHIQFEDIHPFEDGNGRTGRILMNLQRLKIGLPILIIHEGKEQMEYYKWFTNPKGERR